MKKVTFFSRKYKELRVVLDPKTYKVEAGVRMATGLTGKFPIGRSVQFQDGMYTTSDPAEIKALKEHESYGLGFYSDEPGEAAEPTDEALRKENEKKELAEAARSTCPECGKKFANEMGVVAHMKVHK